MITVFQYSRCNTCLHIIKTTNLQCLCLHLCMSAEEEAAAGQDRTENREQRAQLDNTGQRAESTARQYRTIQDREQRAESTTRHYMTIQDNTGQKTEIK